MGFTQNIIQKLAQPIIDENNKEWASRLREAELSQTDDPAYRRISQSNADALNPIDHETMVKLTHYLYWKNPLVRRLVDIYPDFMFRVEITAEDAATLELQGIIDKFWNDPYNDMDSFIQDLIIQFTLDGELFLPVDINPQNGQVYLKFRDPRDIEEIKSVPDNARFVDSIKTKRKGDKDGETFKVIRYQVDPSAAVEIGDDSLGNKQTKNASGYRIGNAFYFRQCNLIQNRGRTPIEPILDWCDAHDRTLFDQLRNNALQGAFVWDVLLQGASETAVEAKRAEIMAAGPPKPGSIRVHNENESWNTVSPTLNAVDATNLATTTRKVIAVGAGRSETWVGASDDVNRSTSDTSQDPPLRSLERSQAAFSSILKQIVDFVIDQAILHGSLNIDADDQAARAFSINMPDLTTTDTERMSSALKNIAEAYQLASDAKLADRGTGRKLFYQTAGIAMPNNLDENLSKEDNEDAEEPYNDPDAEKLLKQKPEGKSGDETNA